MPLSREDASKEALRQDQYCAGTVTSRKTLSSGFGILADHVGEDAAGTDRHKATAWEE